MSPVLLRPAGADRDDWLAARQQGIGASEIAGVLGISPYESPFSLYWRKREGWTTDDNPHMEAGRRLEDAIADWAADRIDPGESLAFWPGGLYASAERPWQLATPDRLVGLMCTTCGGSSTLAWAGLRNCPDCLGDGRGNLVGAEKLAAVLEVKHPGSWDGFGDDGTDEIPVHYRAQLLWQMDVMEVGEGYLAAYHNHDLRIFHLRHDDKDLRTMRTAGAAFWARLEAGEAPPVDEHTATLATLKRLHPSVTDDEVQVDVDLAEGYRRARAAKKRAEALVDRYEARLREAIGGGKAARCGDKLVASRSVFDRKPYEVGPTTIDRLNPGRADSYA